MCPAFIPAAAGCGTVLRGAFPPVIGLLSDPEEGPACDAEEPSAEIRVFAGRGRISAAAERDVPEESRTDRKKDLKDLKKWKKMKTTSIC